MTSDVLPKVIETVLATRGVGGYHQYRIPALAVSMRGTVLAAYDGRPNLDDLPNTIDLLVRRSTDGGLTFGEQLVVRTGEGLEGFGDPSLLVDADTGRIFMFHSAGTHAGFFESATGVAPVDDVQHTDVSISDDDGLTWTHRRLTEQLKKDPTIAGLFAAAGAGIQIHTGPYTGRLVQQFVALVDGNIVAASGLSDDHGETWRLGAWVPAAEDGTGPNENKVVALSDGTLLLHTRATPQRYEARSRDGGETWSQLLPIASLPDPSDNGSVIRFDGLPTVKAFAAEGTAHTLVSTNNQDTHLRQNTVVSISTDDGHTWEPRLRLCAGSSAYSTAARLPGGDLGVLYERDGYREIVFARIPVVALETGLPADRPSEEMALDIVLRSITPARPAVWEHVGAFHIIPSDSEGEWDVQTWKEIGQGYTGDQILGSREAQERNYGAPQRALREGDILAFTGRMVNHTGVRLTAVALIGEHTGEFGAETVEPGGHALFFTPSYTVTAADVLAGAKVLTFAVTAEGPNGTVRSGERTFTVDVGAGTINPLN